MDCISDVWCPFLLIVDRGGLVKIQLIHKHHCTGCIWMGKENLCPFVRCVKHYGWSIKQKDSKRKEQKEHE
ncbi:hypothetical protein ACSVDA_16565 [Cytobacillus sp. Hm23]